MVAVGDGEVGKVSNSKKFRITVEPLGFLYLAGTVMQVSVKCANTNK